MRKRHRALMALSFFIILTIIVGSSVGGAAHAQQRKKSSAKKATSIKKGKASTKVAVKRGKSSVRSSKLAAGGRSRGRSQVSSLRKGGKLTRAGRRSLASSNRRRARARYL